MSQTKDINIQLEGIGTAIKTRRFDVPAYQRSYAWEPEHVEALLNDIHDAIANDEKEYFLGSLVVTGPTDRRYEVVDGQQRLTTVSLLISAIKDRFEADNDVDAAASLRNDYLASVDRRTKEREARLNLNETDNEIFQEIVEVGLSNIDNAKHQRPSHKRLITAAQVIATYIDQLCGKSKDSDELLHQWLDYLDTNLKVILVIASDDSNAFVIFETLNDRGLELAISDLLKNYLFQKSGEKINETKQRWQSMVAILESATEDPVTVQYLRHYAMSQWGLVREKELFGFIKRKVTSRRIALSFSTELEVNAKIYAAIINGDQEFWGKYGSDAREAIATLNLLGMTQIRPLILAIILRFEKRIIAAALKKLVTVAVRFQIVGGIGGGTLEKMYSETAKAVTEGVISNIKQMMQSLSTTPSDSAFEQAFAVVHISKSPIARFYLRALEREARGENVELIPSEDVRNVNLEHVLPLTPNESWTSTWTQDDIRSYQRRFGNLAILSSKKNSTGGNEDFSTKKGIYENSEFVLTKDIAQLRRWDKKAVDERQKKLAAIAVKIWSLR